MVPGRQGAQVGAAAPADVPGLHARQADEEVAPIVTEADPAAQSAHEKLPATPTRKRPAGHTTGVAEGVIDAVGEGEGERDTVVLGVCEGLGVGVGDGERDGVVLGVFVGVIEGVGDDVCELVGLGVGVCELVWLEVGVCELVGLDVGVLDGVDDGVRLIDGDGLALMPQDGLRPPAHAQLPSPPLLAKVPPMPVAGAVHENA